MRNGEGVGVDEVAVGALHLEVGAAWLALLQSIQNLREDGACIRNHDVGIFAFAVPAGGFYSGGRKTVLGRSGARGEDGERFISIKRTGGKI